MRKFVVFAAVLVLTIIVLRRFGPTLGERAVSKCQEMMAKDHRRSGERPTPEFDEGPTEHAGIDA